MKIANNNSINQIAVGIPATPDSDCGVFTRITKLFTSAFNYFFVPNPVTQQREFRLFSTNWEKKFGEKHYRKHIESCGGKFSPNDPRMGRYVRLVKEVGKELAVHSPRKDLDFEFEVINSKVKNAWCLPGGKIGINMGLIKSMEKLNNKFGLGPLSLREKIGAVLSHEMSHANARHGARRIELWLGIMAAVMSFLPIAVLLEDRLFQAGGAFDWMASIFVGLAAPGTTLIYLNRSQNHEFEADKYGMHLMERFQEKRLSPKAGIWIHHFFKSVSPESSHRISQLLSTHPTHEKRIQASLQSWQELKNDHLRNKSIARAIAPKTP